MSNVTWMETGMHSDAAGIIMAAESELDNRGHGSA